jgi:hypothetical protein
MEIEIVENILTKISELRESNEMMFLKEWDQYEREPKIEINPEEVQRLRDLYPEIFDHSQNLIGELTEEREPNPGMNHDVPKLLQILKDDLVLNLSDTTVINLNNFPVTKETILDIVEAMENPNFNPTHLTLTSGLLEEDNAGLKILINLLKQTHCTLDSLDLGGMRIGDEEMQLLLEAPKHPNCKLKYLDLSDNEIENGGFSLLVETLIHPNCKLIEIDMSDQNAIDELDGEIDNAVIDAERRNKNITMLTGVYGRASIAEQNQEDAQNTAEQMVAAFSEIPPTPSSQLLKDFTPRIWAVKYAIESMDEGEEIFQRIEEFCLREFETVFDKINATSKDALKTKSDVMEVLTQVMIERGYSGIPFETPKQQALSQDLVIFVTASQQAKEVSLLVKRFNEKQCPETPEDWDKFSSGVLEGAINKFLDPKQFQENGTICEDRGKKLRIMDEEPDLRTREGRIAFLQQNRIENCAAYQKDIKPIIESPSVSVSSGAANQVRQTPKGR